MKSISMRIILSVLLLELADCRTFSTFTMQSVAPPHPMEIDGRTEDWKGNLFLESEHLELGFLNDRDNLYVCLLTKDDFTRAEILSRGLTVWFDPKGGTHHVLGIEFPLGLPPDEQKLPLRETKEGPELENVPQNVPMTEMEILREKEPPRRLTLSEAKGIDVKVRPTSDAIVYELKIPLASSSEHPIAVGTEPGQRIGIGFESPRLEVKQKHPKRHEGRRQAGEKGELGGGDEGGEAGEGGEIGEAGGRGRSEFGGPAETQEGLKVWAFVSLTRDGVGT